MVLLREQIGHLGGDMSEGNNFFGQRFFSAIQNNPVPFIQVLAVLLLFITFFAVLIAWIGGDTRSQLDIPMVLVGIVVILIIVVKTEATATLTVAVLIVGTVVAGETTVRQIASSFGFGNNETDQQIYGEQESIAARVGQNEDLIKQIVETTLAQSENVSAEKVTLRVSQAISQARLEGLRTIVLENGLRAPLQRLQEGGDTWRILASDLSDDARFVSDMAHLRELDLATFEGSDYADANLTVLGQQVLEGLEVRFTPSFAIQQDGNSLPPSGVENSDDPRIVEVSIEDQPIQGVFSDTADVWFKFEVTAETDFTIETEVAGGDELPDTVLTLYRGEDLAFVNSDDDGGQGFFSRIDAILEPDTYYANIENLNAQPGTFYLTFQTRGD